MEENDKSKQPRRHRQQLPTQEPSSQRPFDDCQGFDSDTASPRGNVSTQSGATMVSAVAASMLSEPQATPRTRKDGRIFVPKNSLTEEMLIAERDRVREKLKRKRREDWTKEEVAEERRTSSRLSEFQSRSRWKKIMDDLKKTSEEQTRHNTMQAQQIAQLRAELQAVQEDNAILRRQLEVRHSSCNFGADQSSITGVPPFLQQSLRTPPIGIEHILRVQAAESLVQQGRVNSLLAASQQQATQQPTQQATPLSSIQAITVAQFLQTMQAQSTQQQQTQNVAGGHSGIETYRGRDGPPRRGQNE